MFHKKDETGIAIALKDWLRCGKKVGEPTGQGKACKSCPLNNRVFESKEHPTFCEDLIEIELAFKNYPKPVKAITFNIQSLH